MTTYKDLATTTPNADMRIVSMITTPNGDILIATSYQIYKLCEGTITPLEFEVA